MTGGDVCTMAGTDDPRICGGSGGGGGRCCCLFIVEERRVGYVGCSYCG